MMNLKDRTVWITGASSGIGEALAYEFAKQGSNLILSSRNAEKLDVVKNRCESFNIACRVIPLDLTDEKQIRYAAGEVIKRGRTDILVNNGGISQRSYAIETSPDIDKKIMETNYFGALNLTKSMLPSMVEQGGAHIVVISSVVGKFGFPLRSAYSASKHALQGFFESLRAELVEKNVRVTIVSPGRIVTSISYNAVTKNGARYGVMDEGQAKGMPADVCAGKIIKAIKRNKKDVLIGGKEIWMVYIRKFLPSLYYKLAQKVKPT
jgi:dehydrogenase/reductase SDR family member 7B